MPLRSALPATRAAASARYAENGSQSPPSALSLGQDIFGEEDAELEKEEMRHNIMCELSGREQRLRAKRKSNGGVEMSAETEYPGMSSRKELTFRNVKAGRWCQNVKDTFSFDKVRSGKQLLVDHALFDIFIGVMILANAIYVGIEVDLPDDVSSTHVESFFASVWVLEAALRIYFQGVCLYFSLWYNVLDFVLAAIAVVDAWVLPHLGSGGDLKLLTVTRIFRVLRVVRMVRLLRMLEELRLLVSGMLSSIPALGWTLLLMAVTIYVFGICFTYLVGKNCDAENRIEWELCWDLYGTLPRSMLSLFQIMVMDMSPVRDMIVWDATMFIPTIMFIMTASLGLMNIVMGVMFEKVLEVSQHNHAKLERQKEARQQLELELLHDLFHEADTDGSGHLSIDEFLTVCERDDIQALFEELELPVSRKRLARRLYEVLDADQGGNMDIELLIERCFQLKTEGKLISTDMTMLLMDVRHSNRRLERIERQLPGQGMAGEAIEPQLPGQDVIERAVAKALARTFGSGVSLKDLNDNVIALRADVSQLQSELHDIRETSTHMPRL